MEWITVLVDSIDKSLVGISSITELVIGFPVGSVGNGRRRVAPLESESTDSSDE